MDVVRLPPHKVLQIARENFKKAGVEELIAVVEGDAHETVKKLEGPIDLLFLDADKKGYLDYLEKLLPLVRPGGLILGHDMNGSMPDPRFIDAINTNPTLDSSFILMETYGISRRAARRLHPGRPRPRAASASAAPRRADPVFGPPRGLAPSPPSPQCLIHSFIT